MGQIFHFLFFGNYTHIYIYTRKPGRSPTRQYGVLRPFLTCAASLDFFWCFKKIFLLATQNQATRVTSQVWTCVKYVPKQSIPLHFEHDFHRRFGHV